MKLRRAIIAVHRDLGYLVAGLTVAYAVSGIAVNHIEDWNPNYVLEQRVVEVGELAEGGAAEIAAVVAQRLAIAEAPTSVVRMSPGLLKVFYEGRALTVSLPAGRVVDERSRRRAVLYELNYLHLNSGKGVWTWVADVYAAGLLVLALTGIFIVPGRKGLGGRGRWLLAAGLLLPALYLVLRL